MTRLLATARLSLKTRVNRNDVIWCYRTLLGREPESEDVVNAHARSGGLRELMAGIVASDEFVRGRRARAFHPMPLPAAQIDVLVGPSQIAAAITKIRVAWSHLGAVKPHFSVLTSEQFLPEHLAGSIDDFWASGEKEAAQVEAILASHCISPRKKTCVEYGCGVGRVTVGLARRFDRVHGYDISSPHLDQADERIRALGLTNVTLVLCAASFLEDLEPCDFLYSRIVFQHNPPPLIHGLVRSALRALKPGGVAIFQVPVYAEGYAFDIDAWLSDPAPQDMEMHCLPQPYIFRAITESHCVTLEVREDNSTGDSRFISNVFVVQRPANATDDRRHHTVGDEPRS